MGLENNCRVCWNGRESEGHAHCGDGEISFKGQFNLRWIWKELDSVSARDGVLTLVRKSQVAEFQLGDRAESWSVAIRNPKSRLDKLGLKPGMRYAITGDTDALFPAECLERAGEQAPTAPFDAVFVRLDSTEDLDRLHDSRSIIEPNGMIWAIWLKGRKELREDDIRRFALANGLVDVKVASFSETLSALKLVIPVALRQFQSFTR